MNLKVVIPISVAALCLPIGYAVCLNWSNLQPYLVSHAESAGELYYFSDRRG
ncbi:MAG: hypothetical protein AAGF97_04645 [Planctomycetota bacterium]